MIEILNIIIPCYNCKDTLSDTLNSLISQTQKKFLVTIVEDGFDDNIKDIVSEYKNKLNIRYIRQWENKGPGLARQIGFDSESLCEYVLFLDSDDMLMPHAVEILNRESSLHKPDILVSNFVQHGKYGISGTVTYKHNSTWLHGKVYSRKFLEENNIRFSTKIRYNEDSFFNTIAFNMAKNICRTDAITVLWRDNKNSITRSDRNFAVGSIPEFIIGKIEALNFLFERKEDNDFKEIFSREIVNIYNHYQIFLHKNKNMEKIIDIELSNFLGRKEINSLFKDKTFLQLIIDSLFRRKKNNFFETQTFSQFMKNFNIEIEVYDENYTY